MRAIEGSTLQATPLYEGPVEPALAIVPPEPQHTEAAEPWFAAAMLGSMLLFLIAFALFVVDPALQAVSQPQTAWPAQGP